MSTQQTEHDAAGRSGSGEAWREIDQAVNELAELSKSSVQADDFHRQVLDRVVTTLAAEGGAVWTQGNDGKLRLAYQVKMAAIGDLTDTERRQQHDRIVLTALESKQPVLSAPQSGASKHGTLSNPSELLLVLSAWEGDASSRGVIEIFQRPRTSPAAQRGYARFLEVVCEIVSDYHRKRQLAELHELKEKWGKFERFSENAHHSLRLKETSYHIANETRHYLDCDRAWVVVGAGRRAKVVAVSGVDTVNRRSTVVRGLERLSRAVIAGGEPLSYDGGSQELPSEIEAPLQDYVDTSHTRTVVIVPLEDPHPPKNKRQPDPIGALVAERFFAGAGDSFRADVQAVSPHCQLALANALYFKQIPFAGALRQIGKLRGLFRLGRLPITLLVLCLLAAAIVALCVIPADFEISAHGELQPVERAHVFAPEDGVIAALEVEHGQQVKVDQPLLTITNPELDLGFSRIWGELQTARARLETVSYERHQNAVETSEQRRRLKQLTAEESELDKRIASLEQQIQIVQERLDTMKVCSPLAGEVVSWNLEKSLRARPVARGQEMLTVANLTGDWHLELRLPDRRVAHVRAARKDMQPDLRVSFILAMDPRETHEGSLGSVGIRTEVSERDGPFVPLTVKIAEQGNLPELVPGATVRARIYCGQRAIGYVWLHELFEAVQRWWAF